jgi:hypothetical protein
MNMILFVVRISFYEIRKWKVHITSITTLYVNNILKHITIIS